MKKAIVIGSRGSDLALWQANHVKSSLENLGHEVSIQIIKTSGDQIQHLSFDKMEGKGFFTKEIEEALLQKKVDLAVHSHKDLETTNPEGLVVACVSDREDPAELILIRKESTSTNEKWQLKQQAIVGTSSGRRKSQLLAFRPDIELKDLRGNVPTRIEKLRRGDYDAIMLAKAGVSRLNLDLSDLEVISLDPKEFIPAPAQGVLGLQIREEDTELKEILAQLNNQEVQANIGIERKVLNLFQGGCQLPLGVYCEKHEQTFKVWTAMAETWDAPLKRHYIESNDATTLASQIVADLKKN